MVGTNLIEELKKDISSSGNNRREFLKLKDGDKVRVKFLTDFPDGVVVKMYNDYKTGVYCRVTEQSYSKYGESLKYRNEYAWAVLVDGKVMIYKDACNRITPIRQLYAFFEEWGSIKGKEFVIALSGKMLEKVYTVIPIQGDSSIPEGVKVPNSEEIIAKIDRAFPFEETPTRSESIAEAIAEEIPF